MLGILGFTKGYVPTEEFSVEAQKEDCLFGLAGEEFNEVTVRPHQISILLYVTQLLVK